MAHVPCRNGSTDEVEREWLARLQEAQARYWQAVERHQRTVEQLDQAVSERSDGSVATAHRAMALALDELARCQKVLVNLVQNPASDEEEKLLI